MANRTLSLVVAGLLAFGGISGCSRDHRSTGNGSTAGDSAKVKAYCDAVDAFIPKAKVALKDPSKLAGIKAQGEALAKLAAGVAHVSSADAKQVGVCTSRSVKALEPGS